MAPRVDEEISFRKLEALVAFLDAGSLARAAEQLDTTPVSIHRALHSLEKALRCPLFRQEGRNLRPTEAARVLANTARDVLQSMSDGVRATRTAAGYGADGLRDLETFGLFDDRILFAAPENSRYAQRIALHFLRTRERDPNVLTLLTVCRATAPRLRSM